MASYPYLARAIVKYKSPHKQDLTFAKGETIRVLSAAPKNLEEETPDDDDDDDEDWLVGESLVSSRKGTFPSGMVESLPAEEQEVPTEPTPEAPPVVPIAADSSEQPALGGAPLPVRPPVDDAEEEEEPTRAAATEPAPESAVRDVPTEEAPAEATQPPVIEEKAAPPSQSISEVATSIPTSSPAVNRSPVSAAPAKSPPPPAAKPAGMSLKDRIAAFNKPAEGGAASPPPLPRSKPGGWKRPAPTPGEKPVIPGAPPAVAAAKPAFISRAAAASEPADKASGDQPVPEARASAPGTGGFSAADAQTSIKMSLKERMAALQRGDGAAAADPSRSISPPAPTPGKLAAERRNVALAGMGIMDDSSSTAPAEAQAEPEQKDGKELPASPEQTPLSPDVPAQEPSPVALVRTDTALPDKEADDETTGEEGSQVELTEEEQEQQRRAAIAKRMAALGGRRMGGGPLFGGPAGPPPVPAKKTSTDPSENAVADAAITEPISAPSEGALSPPSRQATADSAESAKSAEPSPSQTLAVPRRAAPPRRKKSASPVPPIENAVESTPLAPEEAASDIGDVKPAVSTELDEDAQGGIAAVGDAPAQEVAQSQYTGDAPIPDTAIPTSTEEPSELETKEAPRFTAAGGIEEPTAASPVTGPAVDGDEDEQDDKSLPSVETDAAAPLADEEEENEQEAVENPVDLASSIIRPPSTQVPPRPPSASLPPRPPSTSSQIETQPPARTPSAASIGRPPIPRTTLPQPPRAGSTDPSSETPSRRASVLLQHNREATGSPGPAPPRRQLPTPGPPIDRPPIPTSPPPLSTSPSASSGVDNIGDRRLSFAAASAAAEAASGPALAAPRPRHAVPVQDELDDENVAHREEPEAPTDGADGDTPEDSAPSAAEAAGAEPLTEEPVAEEQPPALTEEEEEAERRARIAKRMAALGGQRMGGMPGMPFGAPMPPRRQTSEAVHADVEERTAEPDATSPESAPPRRGPPSGGIAIPGLGPTSSVSPQADTPDLQRAQVATLGGPPDRPPVSERRPSRQLSSTSLAADEATDETAAVPPPLPPGRRSTQVSSAGDEPTLTPDSLGRSDSIRPPVPSAFRSRESSSIEEPVDEDDEESAGGTATILSTPAYDAPPQAVVASPPTAPLSPPPRAPSRVVQPPTSAVPHLPPPALGPSLNSEEQPAPSSTLSLQSKSGSPRDLDLQTGTRWWRAGTNPIRLPPTLAARPDAILYVDQATATKKGRTTHTAVVHVLFEDYSQTIIDLAFDPDDQDESSTSISQRHNAPPPKPSTQQLVGWSHSIGAEIAKVASAASGKSATTYGDGTSRSFISSILSSVRPALQPVGRSFGALLLSQAGPDIMDRGTDEHRAGDIIVCYGLDLRGKKGLASYHTVIGHPQDPAYGIVLEVESKKNKLRCVLVPSASAGKKTGSPEEVSVRLDDAKAGTVQTYRVPPADGWIEEW